MSAQGGRQRAKGGALLGHCAQEVQELPRGARESIQARDQEQVTGTEPVKELLELRPLALGLANLLLEHPLRACCPELGHMGIERLPVRRHTGMANDLGHRTSLPLRACNTHEATH